MAKEADDWDEARLSAEELAKTYDHTPPPPGAWQVLEHEGATPVTFHKFGEFFMGIYQGHEIITIPEDDPTKEPETFRQDVFLGQDGERYAINGGYQLRTALDKASVGQWVRITYKKNIDTGQPSPMKSFLVEFVPTAKATAAKGS